MTTTTIGNNIGEEGSTRKKEEIGFIATKIEGTTEMKTAMGSRGVKLPYCAQNSTSFQFASSSLKLNASDPEFVNSQQPGISCFGKLTCTPLKR